MCLLVKAYWGKLFNCVFNRERHMMGGRKSQRHALFCPRLAFPVVTFFLTIALEVDLKKLFLWWFWGKSHWLRIQAHNHNTYDIKETMLLSLFKDWIYVYSLVRYQESLVPISFPFATDSPILHKLSNNAIWHLI